MTALQNSESTLAAKASAKRSVLVDHIHRHHGARLTITSRDTAATLGEKHARHHHRYASSHYHAGPNPGPEERPPGWYTGEDVVEIERDRFGRPIGGGPVG